MPRFTQSVAEATSMLREQARSNGVGPALQQAAELALDRALAPVEDRLLEREQQRGVLGPAHRRWSGHSAADNLERWQGWDWARRGEEWTESEAWKRSLIDEVLLPTIPAGGTVLEIGPGGGRWSDVLVPRAERVILVDVTPKALELCRERFADAPNVDFVLSHGSDLPGVAAASVDAVWSFDVFVHVAPVDQAGYLAEIARVLRLGGVGAIHHADGRNRGRAPSAAGWRAPMGSYLFRRLAADRGLVVEREIRAWGGGRHGLETFGDTISILRRPA